MLTRVLNIQPPLCAEMLALLESALIHLEEALTRSCIVPCWDLSSVSVL
jgi:hypothetical protein